MSKEIKEKINQILIDYGLVEGKPLRKDIVDKILKLFEEEKERWQEEVMEKIREIEKDALSIGLTQQGRQILDRFINLFRK